MTTVHKKSNRLKTAAAYLKGDTGLCPQRDPEKNCPSLNPIPVHCHSAAYFCRLSITTASGERTFSALKYRVAQKWQFFCTL